MVDLTGDENGQIRARLLDLVPGRSKKAYTDWLTQRVGQFKAGVKVATLDPFHGYKAAIDDEIAEATAVLDAFHVVALGTKCVDEVRRRVQQATTGHRGRKGDPLYGIQNILRAGAENLTDKQRARIQRAFAAHEAHEEVDLTWQCAQQLRSAYKVGRQGPRTADRRTRRRHVPHLPDPRDRPARTHTAQVEGRVPRLLHERRHERRHRAINGLIELHRRLARGFRNRSNYRLRMLLIGGGLNL